MGTGAGCPEKPQGSPLQSLETSLLTELFEICDVDVDSDVIGGNDVVNLLVLTKVNVSASFRLSRCLFIWKSMKNEKRVNVLHKSEQESQEM